MLAHLVPPDRTLDLIDSLDFLSCAHRLRNVEAVPLTVERIQKEAQRSFLKLMALEEVVPHLAIFGETDPFHDHD
jgi:hypothetical protein